VELDRGFPAVKVLIHSADGKMVKSVDGFPEIAQEVEQRTAHPRQKADEILPWIIPAKFPKKPIVRHEDAGPRLRAGPACRFAFLEHQDGCPLPTILPCRWEELIG
jgi:hypothetical protein